MSNQKNKADNNRNKQFLASSNTSLKLIIIFVLTALVLYFMITITRPGLASQSSLMGTVIYTSLIVITTSSLALIGTVSFVRGNISKSVRKTFSTVLYVVSSLVILWTILLMVLAINHVIDTSYIYWLFFLLPIGILACVCSYVYIILAEQSFTKSRILSGLLVGAMVSFVVMYITASSFFFLGFLAS